MIKLSFIFFVTIGFQSGESFHHPTTVGRGVTTKLSVHEDRIKSSGCGLPLVPPGNCELFDPEKEGLHQGTGDLMCRISAGSSYILPKGTSIVTSAPPASAEILDAQHWLEHLDQNGNLPLNFAKPNAPVIATLLARSRIISEDAPGDIQHIVLRLPKDMHYVEGQSLSVLPKGVDPVTKKKYAPRLYSIASTRYEIYWMEIQSVFVYVVPSTMILTLVLLTHPRRVSVPICCAMPCLEQRLKLLVL
jgi:hypothetical protein